MVGPKLAELLLRGVLRTSSMSCQPAAPGPTRAAGMLDSKLNTTSRAPPVFMLQQLLHGSWCDELCGMYRDARVMLHAGVLELVHQAGMD